MDASKAKDGQPDAMKVMRDRYQAAVDADIDNRKLAREDRLFVLVPGNQWDEKQRKARRGRPCYEFPILRSHWRQVVNDQKQARPGIRVSGIEADDKDGAELRQGLIRNIERVSNAEEAYDNAFEEMTSGGFGAWRVVTKYSDDDGWNQDLSIEPIHDAVNRVWVDPDAVADDGSDAKYAFVEETISTAEFKRRYPKASVTSFDGTANYGDWYGKDEVRIAEYHRMEPVKREIVLLSDGRSILAEEYAPIADELAVRGIELVRTRVVDGFKHVVSIVSGSEELEKPVESVFKRIPIVTIYGNRHKVDGRWTWCGMVRWSRDPQKLLNYNLTAAQEIIAKQPKSPYMVTPKMLEGDGIKKLWDEANAIDAPYLAYNPDPDAPGARPMREPPPQMPAALTAMAQMSVDMLKASDGIYDASVGARSNETSGRAIMARQKEGDTATFDYQDSLNNGVRATGKIILPVLPKIYDTPRTVRVLGKDGGEKYVKLYQQVRDEQTGEIVTVNDLSSGKYDVQVSSGASYGSQRQEFVEMVMSISQSNPAILQVAGDLVMGSMDFPKADEVAERLKLMLPPPIQAQMNQGKQLPPEIMQAQQQIEQAGQQLQAQQAEIEQQTAQLESEKADVSAQVAKLQAEHRVMQADYNRLQAELRTSRLEFENERLKALIPPITEFPQDAYPD